MAAVIGSEPVGKKVSKRPLSEPKLTVLHRSLLLLLRSWFLPVLSLEERTLHSSCLAPTLISSLAPGCVEPCESSRIVPSRYLLTLTSSQSVGLKPPLNQDLLTQMTGRTKLHRYRTLPSAPFPVLPLPRNINPSSSSSSTRTRRRLPYIPCPHS